MSWSITIPNWHPTSINKLFGGAHWATRARLKKADEQMVAVYALGSTIPKATAKRWLEVEFVGLRGDVDNYLKTLLDGLVKAGLLVNDNPANLEIRKITAVAGKKATVMTLGDVQ